MDSIINDLENKNWQQIEKYIATNKIDWNYLIDQTNTALHYLAYNDKTDLIKNIRSDILQEIILMPNTEGDTICHIAAKLKNYELLFFAIKTITDIIYIRNLLKNTPLHYIMTHIDIIKSLISEFDIQDHYLNPDYTFLEYYILDGNIEMAEYILNNIVVNNTSNSALSTIVMCDLENNHKKKFIKLLLDAGIKIDVYNNLYQTALILAVKKGDYDMADFLIEHDADVNYGGPENMDNPLATAIKNADVDIVDILIKNGADVNIVNKYFQNAAHISFQPDNRLPVVYKRMILEKCENINKRDNNGDSVLNLLLQNDDWKNYSDILANKKLKIYQANKAGQCPLDYIVNKKDFYDIVYDSYINQLNTTNKWLDAVDNKISKLLKIGKNIGAHRDYIIQKIMHGTSYPERKDKEKLINFMELPETNISFFSSYSYNYICFVLYLLKKYPTIKIPTFPDIYFKNKKLSQIYGEATNKFRNDSTDSAIFRSILRDYINHSPILMNHIIIWKDANMYFIPPYLVSGIKATLERFPKTKFILIKITIVTDENFNHANILLYDTKNRYWERFDPYGKIPFANSQQLDSFLEEYIRANFPETKYLSPQTTAQGISYQIYSDEKNSENYVENDPNGFCVAWCLWYLEMRIKNYHISPQDLISRTTEYINDSEDKFKDYIRKYGNYLDKKKNNILSHTIPEKYWYSLSIPMEYYKKYLKYIRRSYHNLLY